MSALPAWTEEPACFSSPHHRVWLRRRLGVFGSPLVIIGYNPSKAGHDCNDPTARRGIGFGSAIGASDVIFVNPFTGIATDPDELAAMDDPVGSMADEAIQVAARFCRERGGIMVAAWGAPKGRIATRELAEQRFAAVLESVSTFLNRSTGAPPTCATQDTLQRQSDGL